MEILDVFNSVKVSLGPDEEDFLPETILLSALQLAGLNPTNSMLDGILQEMGNREEGKINFNEFKDICDKLEPTRLNEDALKAAFEVFDVDHNGYLDKEEFAVLLQSGTEPLTEDEITYAMEMADIDHDGRIDYSEFVRMMCHRENMKQVLEEAKRLQVLAARQAELSDIMTKEREKETEIENRERMEIKGPYTEFVRKCAEVKEQKRRDAETERRRKEQEAQANKSRELPPKPPEKAKSGCC